MFYSYSVCPIDLTTVAISSILLFVVFFAPGKHTEKLREVDELCISWLLTRIHKLTLSICGGVVAHDTW